MWWHCVMHYPLYIFGLDENGIGSKKCNNKNIDNDKWDVIINCNIYLLAMPCVETGVGGGGGGGWK